MMEEALVIQKVPKESLQIAVALVEVSSLKSRSSVNFLLALAAVVYMAVNVVCYAINYFDPDDPTVAVTSPLTFHLLEFWATFFFNVVEVLALIYSSRTLNKITASPTFLKLIFFLNVASSFIAALLVSINLEKFETVSHELEYANELIMATIDLILLGSLLTRRCQGGRVGIVQVRTTCGVVIAVAIAIIQLFVYNGLTDGEQLAHYFEFTFEVLSAGITFWFTMDSKFLADATMRELLLACQDQAV
eukprot:CAMPEP_0172661642 /NCGR_PEP_ID=MMETSP1074-20121228/4831_1 /TAXON_ID=2916 /ORGANISM="Ceratium fusus, Strain PA161109" /LENGTH=247 /DNA_ID=CAMNT_0013477441 /DNA_START=67 /DNA_END=810 /DNA_ORIENTATION=+